MNKEEAIQKMREGHKITHRWFDSSEWMTINSKGHIELEDGVVCTVWEFFYWRNDSSWEDGYSLYKEK